MTQTATKTLKRDVHGWIVLDKPKGMSSTRAVSRVKHLFRAKKAGHAGTLDPLATGLLAIALGEATKTVSFAMDGKKTYAFTISWGVATDTEDSEGEIVDTSDVRPSPAEIEAILPDFTGTILQRPPVYSALKVDGKRAYKLARAGHHVSLEPRLIEIESLKRIDSPDEHSARFKVSCAKGTYIRALARDIAEKLGTKGHITALRRTQIGALGEDRMFSLDKLEELSHIGARQEALMQVLLSVETVLDDIPVLAVNSQEAARLKNGQAVLLGNRNAPQMQGMIFVASSGCPIAIAELKQGALHPKRVFNLPMKSGD
jgi:tRNA pseudouridine55 synthase